MTHTIVLAHTNLKNQTEAFRTYYIETVFASITDAIPTGTHELIYASETSWHQIRKALAANTSHLIIPGGEDLHPSFYDGPLTYQDQGDQHQINAIQYALSNNINLLGLCRGMQAINVALGGTLHQHNPDHSSTGKEYEERYTQHKVIAIEPHPAIVSNSFVIAVTIINLQIS